MPQAGLARMEERPAPPVIAQGRALAANAAVRWSLYLYVFSIPFEMPDRTIPIEIPTLTASIFLIATLFQARVCYGRMPQSLRWFGLWLWVFTIAALLNSREHAPRVLLLLASMIQLLLLFWTTSGLFREDRVMRGTLLAMVAACALHAVMQVAGVAVTSHAVWTGGERVTIFGQNANLSALILSIGVLGSIGLRWNRTGRTLRPRILVWPLMALIATAVVDTGSRGALLALASGVAVLLFRGRTIWQRLRGAGAVALAMALLVWVALHSDMMRKRLVDVAENGNLAGREEIYPALIDMFRERPLLGWGPVVNQFELASRMREPLRPSRDAHNIVLELLTTTGILGTLPFLVGLALCIRAAWRGRRGRYGALPVAMLAVMAVGVMSGTWIASKILWFVLACAEGSAPALSLEANSPPLRSRSAAIR